MKLLYSCMRVFYFLLLCGFLFSCDKNKELVQYTEYFHRDADTTYSLIAVPNSFTPGNDRINDYFNVIVNGFYNNDFEVTIYTKNNEPVFYSNNNYYQWDGTKFGEELPLGNYFYHIKATDVYGYVYDIKGQVNLLR